MPDTCNEGKAQPGGICAGARQKVARKPHAAKERSLLLESRFAVTITPLVCSCEREGGQPNRRIGSCAVGGDSRAIYYALDPGKRAGRSMPEQLDANLKQGGSSAALAPEGRSLLIGSFNRRFEMKLLKGLLLGSAAALVSVTNAHAAEPPPTVPIEYVRICDAYGAGFFYIPGTDTCLKVGGLALTEVRSYDASYSVSGASFQGNGSAAFGTTNPLSLAAGAAATLRAGGGGASTLGFVPTGSQYSNARQRDNYGWNSLGRLELDSRTGTPWGTLRAFIRVDSLVGTGYSSPGALNTGTSFNSNPYNTSAGVSAVRET